MRIGGLNYPRMGLLSEGWGYTHTHSHITQTQTLAPPTQRCAFASPQTYLGMRAHRKTTTKEWGSMLKNGNNEKERERERERLNKKG